MHVAPRATALLLLAGLPLSATAQALPQEADGLTGHVGIYIAVPDSTFGHGYSYYSTAHVLSPQPTFGTQLGWGSWALPDNRNFSGPLCYPGTNAYDNWPEWGPTWHGVFQTIEGGMGQWVSTRFPWSTPKFRINATPDCYDTQIGSPGWSFGGEVLPTNKLGLAQLGNRLLVPPDGIPFTFADAAALVGAGWLPLPLLPATTYPLGVPTGDRSWTLFLRAGNFRGPVAFYTPEVWSALHALDDTGAGRGHDAIAAVMPSLALEIGQTPVFTATDDIGVRYRRVPRMQFPANAAREAVLIQDTAFYSKAAIWDAVADWIADGTVATGFVPAGIHVPALTNPFFSMELGGDPVAFGDALHIAAVPTGGGGYGFSFVWGEATEAGVFPEYYRADGDAWTPVAPDEVPPETALALQAFSEAPFGSVPLLDTSASSPWSATNWTAGPYTTALLDGSEVDYVWYHFVDQPAIARLQLPVSVRDQLQAFVESLHQNAGLTGLSIPPPTAGELADIDPGLLVTPPPGLGQGYVPIAIAQRLPVPDAERLALEALYASTNGAGWLRHDNWLAGPVEDWYGVTVVNARVRGLDLRANALAGPLPVELGTLTALQTLELSSNQLSGNLPDSLGNLQQLTFLSAWNNQLTGPIPAGIGDLSSLELLQLGANGLSGAIPPDLGRLVNLKYLFLADNQLSGRLPPELARLGVLQLLDIAFNPLHGQFPPQMASLASLQTLHYESTQVCDPPSGAFLDWLESLGVRTPSGLTCDYVELFRTGFE